MKHILKIFTIVILIGAGVVLTTSIIRSETNVIQLKYFTPPTPTPATSAPYQPSQLYPPPAGGAPAGSALGGAQPAAGKHDPAYCSKLAENYQKNQISFNEAGCDSSSVRNLVF